MNRRNFVSLLASLPVIGSAARIFGWKAAEVPRVVSVELWRCETPLVEVSHSEWQCLLSGIRRSIPRPFTWTATPLGNPANPFTEQA